MPLVGFKNLLIPGVGLSGQMQWGSQTLMACGSLINCALFSVYLSKISRDCLS